MEFGQIKSTFVKPRRPYQGFQVAAQLIILATLLFCSAAAFGKEPWTTSNLKGSPEPPPPYLWQRIHPKLNFIGAISINRIPNSSKYVVLEHQGNIYSFDDSETTAKSQLLWQLNEQRPKSAISPDPNNSWIRLFSCTFDPNYSQNHYFYLCYVVESPKGAKTHISRFVASDESKFSIDTASELNILRCDGGGHNGCTLAFGPDKNLYISLGDLGDANPPDGRNTGQDISDLYANILRIDVHNASSSSPYKVPTDNPFINTPNAAPEVYAYGLRNPFRMCFDPASGELWVADVGWETWELIYRIKSGGNYGWSVKEGSGNAKNGKVGPTPILSPDVELPHSIAASITGGMFYYGKSLPKLTGQYICGDWITRTFWSVAKDGPQAFQPVEIAQSEVKPICFEVDQNGEILVLDYNEMNTRSGIYRLVENKLDKNTTANFPKLLSQTGLFRDTSKYEPAAGVHTYVINEAMWMEGASAEFLVALPDNSHANIYQTPQVMFNWYMTKVRLPEHGVLLKTYQLPIIEGTGIKNKRIETQIQLKDEDGNLQYYTYRWLDDQSDAYLVGKDGETASYRTPDTKNLDRSRVVQWPFANRTQCRVCHTPWLGESIAFTESQLRQPKESSDSWRKLIGEGVVEYSHQHVATNDSNFRGVVSSTDQDECIHTRARSYLHANCSHCHLRGGNASTSFDLRLEKTAREMEAYDLPTMRGGLGLTDPKIISAGSPHQSVLWLRMATSGTGHMPAMGSRAIDSDGVALIANWISSLPRGDELRSHLDAITASSDSNYDKEQRLNAATELLKTQEGVMLLSQAYATNAIVPWLRRDVITMAMNTNGPMRELLEAYAGEKQRPNRLGPNFPTAKVLDLDGNADHGRELFRNGVGQCNGCHQLEANGRLFGPDLSQLSNPNWKKPDLLRQITNPSELIHPKYVSTIALTADGQVITGLVVDDSESKLVLRDANGTLQTFVKDDLEEIRRSDKSLMPEGLFDALTAQQAADLLEYVWSSSHKP